MKEALTIALARSLVRKLMSVFAGALLASGWINAELADRLTTEAVTLIATALVTLTASVWLTYKNVILEFVKTRVGIALPPTSTIETVEDIAKMVENKTAVATGAVDPFAEVNNAR